MSMWTNPSYYLQTCLLCSPSGVLFTLLIFILSKDLHATPLQLTILACLKPTTSLISYYISSIFHGKSQLIRPYLAITGIIGILPCFLYPVIDNVWYYIASYAIYMITKRAQEPAWIELLKTDLQFSDMAKIVSKGGIITYFITICLPVSLSYLLDQGLWKILFCCFAGLQLLNACSLFFLKTTPTENKAAFMRIPEIASSITFSGLVIDPLKKSLTLLKRHPNFFHYLVLFFLGGAGIIAIYPILPEYFNETLGLSYTQLTLSFSFCKGISFLIGSPLWARYVKHISLYRLNVLMNLLTCLFIVGVLAAQIHVEWLYVGYLCYGAMQGGCELSWNLSGPFFSKKEDSAPYSALNLITIGIRGCLCPGLGYLMCLYGGPTHVLIAALCTCVIGIFYGLWLDVKFGSRVSEEPRGRLAPVNH